MFREGRQAAEAEDHLRVKLERPAELHPALLRAGQSRAHPFAQDLPFELRHRRNHREDDPAGRGRRVDLLVDRDDRDAERTELLQRRDEIGHRSAEAIEPPDDHLVDDASARRGQELIEGRSTGCRARHAAIDKLGGHVPVSGRGIPAQFHELVRVLIDRGNPGVQGDTHRSYIDLSGALLAPGRHRLGATLRFTGHVRSSYSFSNSLILALISSTLLRSTPVASVMI